MNSLQADRDGRKKHLPREGLLRGDDAMSARPGEPPSFRCFF